MHNLIEGALQGALGGSAVVAEDVVDQRAAELSQAVDRLDKTPDVMVGEFQVAGVDLHLPAQDRLHFAGHVVPRGD